MTLQLAPDEPEAGPWRAESLTVAAATVMQPGQGKGAGHRPVVLAVDGRSSSGKTTLAGRLRDVVAGSAVVHTDDIAWWHSRFGWADLLTDGVLLPARAGQQVTFRPPQWDQRQRPGAIEVPAGCPLLIIEGGDRPGHDHRTLNDAALAHRRSPRPTGAPANSHGQLVTSPGKPAASAPPEKAQFAAWKSALVHRPAGGRSYLAVLACTRHATASRSRPSVSAARRVAVFLSPRQALRNHVRAEPALGRHVGTSRGEVPKTDVDHRR